MSADLLYDITTPLTADVVGTYVDANNKPLDQTPDSEANKINPIACAYQNVSDSVHDGLKESGAQDALPKELPKYPAQHEDDHLETFLYKLNKDNPKLTELKEHMKANYESYFRIPLFNGGNQNVDANGTPTYGHRVSVIESMLDKIGVSSPNIFLSYDFGFPEVKYDIGYAKTRQFYVGYRPCQENDAAGKPTLSSSNAPGFGLLSPQVPVEFIWTNRAIEPFSTYLPRYTGGTDLISHTTTPPSENYALSRFNMYIGWDRSDPVVPGDKNEADVLKSSTVFYDPDAKELLLSNSDWTSKSGKDQKQYEKFSKELLSIKDKSPIELISPEPIITGHQLQTQQFDLFHALAKNSGDKLTAITYPNSYTPEMLASVMWINKITPEQYGISITDETGKPIDVTTSQNLYIQHIGSILLNNPTLAGSIAETIDTSKAKLDNNEIKDLITANTHTDMINLRQSLRSKPRLFRKLKNKSEPITDPNNYDYMWLTDYVFVYVTHDRLAAACALERLVDIVILESPRQGDKSVFSLFVRKNTKDPTEMLTKNIENMRQKITALLSEQAAQSVSDFLKIFGITLSNQPYRSLSEITTKFQQIQTYILAQHSNVIAFDGIAIALTNDEILKKNIVIGLISNVFQQIETSYNKLLSSFKNISGIQPESDIPQDLLAANFATHIQHVKTTFVVQLNKSFEILNGPNLSHATKKTYFDETNSIFYKAKEYLQIYSALQELYDKIFILSRIQSVEDDHSRLLDILEGTTDTLAKLLTPTIKSQIRALNPSVYISTNSIQPSRTARTPKDWFSSSKDALKRVISGDLPNSFGLTKLFLKLIPMMNPKHVTAIFQHYGRIASITLDTAESKLDFKIVINCLKAIFPGSVFVNDVNFTKNILAKLTEYDELFTLIVEEEKTMLKQLEKAGKLVTKCLSKKKQLLQQTKEAEIADKIKSAVNSLIPQQSIMSSIFSTVRGRGGGRKTSHKYKLRKSVKTTCKNRKSGGANVFRIRKDETNVKLRIEFFYRCITMYILYLINVRELYLNLLGAIRKTESISALLTKLILIIDNIWYIIYYLIEFVDELAKITGNTLTALFGKSSNKLIIEDSVEYSPKQMAHGSVQMGVSVTNKDQISVLLEDAFNLHLVNVGTYLFNIELIPDDLTEITSYLQYVVDELVDILDTSHSGLIEYIFVNDNDKHDGASPNIDVEFASKAHITPDSYNFGYNHALSSLLKYNQIYLNTDENRVNEILSHRDHNMHHIYNYSVIQNEIIADLIATEKYNHEKIDLTGSSYVKDEVHESVDSSIEETTKEPTIESANSSLMIDDVQPGNETAEKENIVEVLNGQALEDNSSDNEYEFESNELNRFSDQEGDYYFNNLFDSDPDEEENDLHHLSDQDEEEKKVDPSNWRNTRVIKLKRSFSYEPNIKHTNRKQKVHSRSFDGLDVRSNNNEMLYNNHQYGGNKTRKRLTKIKSRKYTKKYQKTTKHLRKTRKNTKRPKYIKKHATKRRR